MIAHTFSNPVVGAGFIPARKRVEIRPWGGHEAHPCVKSCFDLAHAFIFEASYSCWLPANEDAIASRDKL